MNNQTLGFSSPADDNEILAAKLKEAREYIGLKQEQVAAHLGIPRSAVSEIEKGKRTVSAIELKKLAQLYHRSVQFFTGEGPAIPADVAFLARTAESLSDGDRQELQRFAEFLKSKTKK